MVEAARRNHRNRKLLLYGAALGVVYGLAIRAMIYFDPRAPRGGDLMLAGFLIFTPLAMGYIAVFFAEVKERQRDWVWLLLPWVPVVGWVVAAMLAFLEGAICIVMFLPLGLIASSVGGVLGGASARALRSRRSRRLSLTCVVFLPLMVFPWEQHVLHRGELRRVENVIDIHAPAAVVWNNIGRVPRIDPKELPLSWSHAIGIPDPLEATLSNEGIGGIRKGYFTEGLMFIESVDVWEPERRLAFSIRAQTDAIPAGKLDEHVRVGGQYFDVLSAEYQLELLPNGKIRLHLSSQHRLSTDFNWYAHLWTDAIMADFQRKILHVVKHRCERTAAPS